jgi:hypothetical protein
VKLSLLLSSSAAAAATAWIISEFWIDKVVKGRGRDLILDAITIFAWKN